MASRQRLALVATVLAAMAAVPAGTHAQQDPPRPEVIVHEGDPPRIELRGIAVPIRQVVADPEGRFNWGAVLPGLPSPGPPPGVDLLEWLVQQAELVVVVDVVAGSPRLNDRGDFILTDWRARVTRVFKSSDESWTAGQAVTFTNRGGIMTVEGTVVEAVVPWERPIRVGSRYLVFTHEKAREGTEELREVSLGSMYEFDGLNAIRRVHHLEGPDDALEASFQAEIVTRLEELTGAR